MANLEISAQLGGLEALTELADRLEGAVEQGLDVGAEAWARTFA